MRRIDLPPFFFVALDLVIVRCPRSYPAYLQTGVCLARFDPRGWFVLLSAAWESALGFPRAELHGRALLELLPPAEAQAGEAALRRILDPAEADPLVLALRRKDGSPQPMRWYRRFDPYDATLLVVAESSVLKAPQCRAPSSPGRV
jgi:PAS domain S-box-containing protein